MVFGIISVTDALLRASNSFHSHIDLRTDLEITVILLS